MPRNGSGTYSLPEPPYVAGTVISSAAMNDNLSDIATALTGSLPRDGQAGMTGQFRAVDGSVVGPSISFVNESESGFYRVGAGVIGIDILGTQVGEITADGIAGTVPIGAILDFPAATLPSTWYLCFGQAVSRTTYVLLFNVIGTTFGSGDGSTTFNLPDYRGRVLVGVDNMGGSAAGRLTSTYYGANPDVLGTAGGGQNQTLTAAQAPTITSNVSVSVSVSGSISGTAAAVTGANTYNSPGGATSVVQSLITGSAAVTGIFSGSGSGTGSATSNNTSGQPHTIVQPSSTTNKIIFAGV